MIPARSPDNDPNTAAGPNSRCSVSFGYLPRPWVTVVIIKLLSPYEKSWTQSTFTVLRPPPLSPSSWRPYEKRAIREVNDGCWTLALEPAYLPPNQRHLIPPLKPTTCP